jgi:hypothetical protein
MKLPGVFMHRGKGMAHRPLAERLAPRSLFLNDLR